MIKGRDGERVDVFQKDWLHRDGPGGRRKKLAHDLAGRGDRLHRHRRRRAQGDRRPRLRVARSRPAWSAGSCRRCRPTRWCSTSSPARGTTGPRGRPAERRRRRHPPLHQRQLRRARRGPAPTPTWPGTRRSPTSRGPGCRPWPRRVGGGLSTTEHRGLMMSERVALVTGASSGIGRRPPACCTQAGFTSYAVARRVDRMAALEKAGVHTFAMDVTDDASMVAGVERVVDEQGRIDVLVNNAGYGSYGAVEDVPIDEARRQFEVNVFGLARLTQLVLADHARAGQRAGSSTSPRSAGSSTSRWARGTTRPSSRSRASATACASSSRRSASTSSSSSPARSSPSGTPSPATASSRRAAAAPTRSEPAGSATMERGDTGWAGTRPSSSPARSSRPRRPAHPTAGTRSAAAPAPIVLARRRARPGFGDGSADVSGGCAG